jgi:hypothetical protein
MIKVVFFSMGNATHVHSSINVEFLLEYNRCKKGRNGEWAMLDPTNNPVGKIIDQWHSLRNSTAIF